MGEGGRRVFILFPRGISLKVKAIAQKFKLINYNIAVHHIRHNSLPNQIVQLAGAVEYTNSRGVRPSQQVSCIWH